MATDGQIEEMLGQYIETALWASTDNTDDSGGEPLDANYSESDLSDAARASMREDCADFLEANATDIGDRFEQAGHDFWLTRNGHGAGFWDGDWPDDAGKRLTIASKSYGSSDIYVGDDGKLYLS